MEYAVLFLSAMVQRNSISTTMREDFWIGIEAITRLIVNKGLIVPDLFITRKKAKLGPICPFL